jgi:phosphatidylglycerol:prolipoprotein diacylglycerol transferase
MAIEMKLDPIAFSIGPITVGWYGIMVALAVITIVAWALYWAKRDPLLSTDRMLNVALVGIPSGIIFARLLHVLDDVVIAKMHPELAANGAVIDYLAHPALIIGGSGLTIWGAVLGAALGLWVYSKIVKISFSHLADMLAPGIILSQAVGRVGCTILGDDTGLPTSLPWGFIYTSPNSPTNMAVGLTATHPVVAYEIIFNLIVFGILLLLRKKLRPEGSLFLVYLTFYAAWRLGGDFLREGTPFLFGLHQAQFISVVILIISLTLLIWRTRWVKKGVGPGLEPPLSPDAG